MLDHVAQAHALLLEAKFDAGLLLGWRHEWSAINAQVEDVGKLLRDLADVPCPRGLDESIV